MFVFEDNLKLWFHDYTKPYLEVGPVGELNLRLAKLFPVFLQYISFIYWCMATMKVLNIILSEMDTSTSQAFVYPSLAGPMRFLWTL